MTNYRPISLLISFSKILETAVFNRLQQYLQANKILVTEQFGFRKGSTVERVVFTFGQYSHLIKALRTERGPLL
jgi:hypothetical protein